MDTTYNEQDHKKKILYNVFQIIWEQLIIQIGGTAGQEFIDSNRDLNLSLRKADHILDEEGFVNGEMPSHNFNNAEKYQKRYEEWNANFSDESHEHLNNNYRDAFDETRPKGSASMHMDHTIPVKEFISDEKAAAFMDKDDIINFANDTDINLKPLDASANESKGDRNVSDWSSSTRDGKTPEERFNIDMDEIKQNDKHARKEWEQRKEQAQKNAVKQGNASRTNEALRSMAFVTQAVGVALCAKLIRQIMQQVFIWSISKHKSSKTLLQGIKKAITDFIYDFKNNILLSVDVGVTALLTQIYGRIIITIRQALLLIQVGGKSLKDVYKYLKNPENANKDRSTVVLEVGRIVTVGLTTGSGIALGHAITLGLEATCPALTMPIPLFGSPSIILGIFFGGLTSGVCGALVINYINERLKRKEEKQQVKLIEQSPNKSLLAKIKDETKSNVNSAKGFLKEGVKGIFKGSKK